MDRLLIDTNVIVRYLRGSEGILADILGSYKLAISAVTVAELMATKRANDKFAADKMMEFIQENFEIIPVSKDIAAKAGELLRELDIAFVHAVVATTALHEDLPLVTYEIKTFDNIPDLKIVDL
jgi:predicted nucleic acid-binding protein